MKKILTTLLVAVCLYQTAAGQLKNLTGKKPLLKAKNIRIKIQYAQTSKDDSLVLFQSLNGPFAIDPKIDNFRAVKAARKKDGWFIFDLKSNSDAPNYIMIAKMRTLAERGDLAHGPDDLVKHLVVGMQYAEAGDDVTIIASTRTQGVIMDYREFISRFSGKGALKYRLRYIADSIGFSTNNNPGVLSADFNYNPDNYKNHVITAGLKVINFYKTNLTANDYDELLDYVTNNLEAKEQEARLLHFRIKENISHFDPLIRKRFLKTYDSAYSAHQLNLPLAVLLQSTDYALAELGRQEIRSFLITGSFNRDSIYQILQKSYQGEFRERILTLYFVIHGKSLNNYNVYLDDATKIIKSKLYAAELSKMQTKMTGKLAFNFALPDTSGKKVRLSDFRGKVVFIDFWYTGCGGCANFYQTELAHAEDSFSKNPDVVFITISIDDKKKLWVNSINSRDYTSPSVTNLYTDGKGFSCDVIKYYQINSFPQPMVIGKDQRIVTVGSELSSAAGVTKVIEKALEN